jgi:hypothetical protein
MTNRKPEWFFYPAWIVLTAACIPLAWSVMMALLSLIIKIAGDTIVVAGQTHITEDFLGLYILFPAIGLLSGLLQYPLLRRYLPRMGAWIGVTLLGWLLMPVSFALISGALLHSLAIDSKWSGPVAFVLVSVLVALPQWLVLRRRARHAALWSVARLVGWVLTMLVTGANISTAPDVLAVCLLPPAVECVAWWLMLDRLVPGEGQPQGNGKPIAGTLAS